MTHKKEKGNNKNVNVANNKSESEVFPSKCRHLRPKSLRNLKEQWIGEKLFPRLSTTRSATLHVCNQAEVERRFIILAKFTDKYYFVFCSLCRERLAAVGYSLI